MTIITIIVSLIVIILLSMLMVFSIEKISTDTVSNIKRNASKYMYNYDESLEEKRREMQRTMSYGENGSYNEDKKVFVKPNYARPLNIKKENKLSTADAYKIIRNQYDLDPVEIARKLLNENTSNNGSLNYAKNIINKIDKDTFALLDTLSKKDQIEALKEVLDENEINLIIKIDKYGINLYEFLDKFIKQKQESIVFYVAGEKLQSELKEKLGVDSIISDELVEGMNVIINDKVYKYSIERNELQ